MQFFKKSNKNKTASAVNTPAQTPRHSLEAQRPSMVDKRTDAKNHDEILAKLLKDTQCSNFSFGQNVYYARLCFVEKSRFL
ncbi:hypothetical protein BGZ73_004501 [Actinomortierella ambigua]|nr:hypothetical protein BGZ73_004501 [Actinomortierella ambigua]